MFHFLFNINFLKGGNQDKGFEKVEEWDDSMSDL